MDLKTLAAISKTQKFFLGLLIFHEPHYKENVKKGLPFFTGEELNEIEEGPNRKGLTFEQVDKILAKKSMIVKAPTFKRYIGLGLVSGTERIERTKRGNIGYYPTRVIREVNLVKYCLFIDSDLDELLGSSIRSYESSVLELIEAQSAETVDILANISDPELSERTIGPVLQELSAEKIISAKEKKQILRAVERFQDACQEVWNSYDTLYTAMEDVKLPGLVVLTRIFGRQQISEEDQ